MRIHGSSPSPWALVKFGTVVITVVFLAATGDRPNGSNDAIPTAASAETAESIKDMSTAGTARARLAQPDTLSQAAMMNQGLDLLYRKGDPAGAGDKFRQVLQRNPRHYGATFQLAKAPDQAG